MRLVLPFAFLCGLAGCFINVGSSCSDGLLNSSESGIDCGGSCSPCAVGTTCFTNADCSTQLCQSGRCASVAATCNDGARNGAETDVDCGGAACSACAATKHCSVAADCASQVCTASVCTAANCTDGVRNSDETGADCGGATCPPCFTTPTGGDTFTIKANVVPAVPNDNAPLFFLQSSGVGSFQLTYATRLSTQHEVWGSIFVPGALDTDQPITCVTCSAATYVQAKSVTSPNGTRIDFYGTTLDTGSGEMNQGFYFGTNAEPIIIDLYIDGVHDKSRVYFVSQTTTQVANPTAIPFKLATH